MLKGLKAITFIHHLAIKFHIEAIVATIKGPQECDLNSICKATPRLVDDCIMIVDVEMVKTIMVEAPIVDAKMVNVEKSFMDDDINLRAIE